MKPIFALLSAAILSVALLFLSGCAAPGSKETGYCSADSDCKYYAYAGGCYTPENMNAILDEQKRMGITYDAAKEIPGAYCTCELNKCKLNVPAQGGETATIEQLANNPQAYLGKNVTTEGVLFRTVGGKASDAKYYLSDGNGDSIMVAPFAQYSVPTCPPSSVSCNPPRTLADYIGNKVRILGALEEMETPYAIMKAYYWLVPSSVEIIGEAEAGVMTKELCESANGRWENASNGETCTCAGEGRGCPGWFECRVNGALSGSCVPIRWG